MPDAFILTIFFDWLMYSTVMPDMWLHVYCNELYRGCWWRGEDA